MNFIFDKQKTISTKTLSGTTVFNCFGKFSFDISVINYILKHFQKKTAILFYNITDCTVFLNGVLVSITDFIIIIIIKKKFEW